MKTTLKVLSIMASAGLLLVGCSSPFGGSKVKFSEKEYGVKASERVVNDLSARTPKGGGRHHIGKPYKIAGKWYYPKNVSSLTQTGKASWYGPTFHGRKTANGEIFDMHSLSAAHPTLPLPSYVRVTNTDNDASVVVRVNDRGPFAKGRVIDVSKRTAEMLGFKSKGIGNVKIEFLKLAALDGEDEAFLVSSFRDGTSASSSQLAFAPPREPVPASEPIALASALFDISDENGRDPYNAYGGGLFTQSIGRSATREKAGGQKPSEVLVPLARPHPVSGSSFEALISENGEGSTASLPESEIHNKKTTLVSLLFGYAPEGENTVVDAQALQAIHQVFAPLPSSSSLY